MSRSRAVPEVKALISEVKDPVLHREAVRIASEALDVDAASLEVRGEPETRRSRPRARESGESQDPLTQAGREVLALILTRPDLATKPLREGVPTESATVSLSPEDFADEPQSAIFSALQEHVNGDLGDALSDERLRSHIDHVSSLSLRGERLYPSEASIRVAWLRLRILRREREKRRAEDFDLKYQIHTEVQSLQRSLRAAEAAAS